MNLTVPIIVLENLTCIQEEEGGRFYSKLVRILSSKSTSLKIVTNYKEEKIKHYWYRDQTDILSRKSKSISSVIRHINMWTS